MFVIKMANRLIIAPLLYIYLWTENMFMKHFIRIFKYFISLKVSKLIKVHAANLQLLLENIVIHS